MVVYRTPAGPALGKACVFHKTVSLMVHRAHPAQAPMPMHNVRDCHVGERAWSAPLLLADTTRLFWQTRFYTIASHLPLSL